MEWTKRDTLSIVFLLAGAMLLFVAAGTRIVPTDKEFLSDGARFVLTIAGLINAAMGVFLLSRGEKE